MLKALLTDIYASPIARAGIFGLAYFAAAELGHALSLKTQDKLFATFWPPAGLLLAALARTPCRTWPVLLLAACGANLASDVLLHGKSVPVSLGFCVANCGEACLGAWLLRRFVGMPLALARVTDVVGLAGLSALISPLLGATIGAGIVTVGFSGVSYWSTWQVWWMADAVGVLVFAPIVLTWTAEGAAFFKGIRTWRIVECVALFLVMILVAESIYGEFLPLPLSIPVFVLPFLLWAGLRFGPSSAAAAVLVVALIGVWNTSQGRGPYAAVTAEPSQQLLRAQATLCAISLCVLALAATVAERKQAEQQRIKLIAELEQALHEIKTLRGLIPLCAWCKKIRDDGGYWQSLEDYLRAHTEAEFTHGLCPNCLRHQVATIESAGPDQKEM
jgi:integral membrane sensor domain MASE1